MAKNKKGFTVTEMIIGGVVLLIIAGFIVAATIDTNGKDPVEKIKEMGYTLQSTVKNAESELGQKSLDWDYSLKPNDFFKKYLDKYLNYSYILERNLEYDDQSTVYYVYYADNSYIQLKKGECMEYHYDANGAHKPNVYGQDQYIFYLCPRAYASKNNFINKM